MFKKIIPILLILSLVLCVGVTAEEESAPAPAQESVAETVAETTGASGDRTPPSDGQFPLDGQFPSDMPSPPQDGSFPDMSGGFSGMFGSSSGTQSDAGETEDSYGAADFFKEYATPVTSLVLLGLAFVFAAVYKRKQY